MKLANITIVLLVCAHLAGCQTHPKDVAFAVSESDYGIVYPGVVWKVAPIFVRNSADVNRLDAASQSAAGVVRSRFVGAVNQTRIAIGDVLAELAAAGISEAEAAYRSRYCQYFVRVKDTALTQALKFEYRDNAQIDALTNELDNLRQKLETNESRSSQLRSELRRIQETAAQNAAAETNESETPQENIRRTYLEQERILNIEILELEASSNSISREELELKEIIKANLLKRNSVVGVVGLCWRFSEGQQVLLTKFRDNIAIQPR